MKEIKANNTVRKMSGTVKSYGFIETLKCRFLRDGLVMNTDVSQQGHRVRAGGCSKSFYPLVTMVTWKETCAVVIDLHKNSFPGCRILLLIRLHLNQPFSGLSRTSRGEGSVVVENASGTKKTSSESQGCLCRLEAPPEQSWQQTLTNSKYWLGKNELPSVRIWSNRWLTECQGELQRSCKKKKKGPTLEILALHKLTVTANKVFPNMKLLSLLRFRLVMGILALFRELTLSPPKWILVLFLQ